MGFTPPLYALALTFWIIALACAAFEQTCSAAARITRNCRKPAACPVGLPCRSFADWDCRNGEEGSALCPFPSSSHREAAKPLPCDGAQARYSLKIFVLYRDNRLSGGISGVAHKIFCAAHKILCVTHKILCVTHKVLCAAHKIFCVAHKIV